MAEVMRFEHEGLTCAVAQVEGLGHHCGYVRLPEGHMFYGMDYDAIHGRHGNIEVHGGLTYSDNCCPYSEPDGGWWIGFDAAHAGDLVPGLGYTSPGDVYRDAEFMANECRNLATQITMFDQLPL